MAVTFGLASVALVTGCSGGSQVTVPPGATSPPATSTPTPVPSATPTSPGAPTPTPSPTASTGFAPDNWPLVDHDAARSGVSNEVTSSHGAIALQKLWQTNLGGIADSGPIIEGSMLYVTVHDGTTYGIATSNGAKIWSFTTSGPNITTSEPAFDVAGNEVYAGGVDGKVHQLNPATGVENTKGGFPVLVTLATATEKDASPLNVANGYVYAQTSAYDGDGIPYVGHVVAISTATGQSQVFNTLCSSIKGLIAPATCSQNRSGMWSRAGVVVDPDPSMNGEIFVATGNGDSDPSVGDYGDSVLGLASNAGSLVGSFAPSNAAMLEADDLDLGSSSPALIPRQPSSSTPLMAVSAGKDAMLRLLNRANLGGPPLQTIGLGSGLFSAPAVYASPSGTTYVYVGLPNGVTAYAVTTTNGATQLVVAWTASVPLGSEGTSPVVRDGVVYVAATNELVALDATTGAILASNPSLGGVHWESPSIADGVVYCSDQNGNLTAFAIVPQSGSSARVRKATDATSR
jgi:outer membrane protein assembly factor BamB